MICEPGTVVLRSHARTLPRNSSGAHRNRKDARRASELRPPYSLAGFFRARRDGGHGCIGVRQVDHMELRQRHRHVRAGDTQHGPRIHRCAGTWLPLPLPLVTDSGAAVAARRTDRNAAESANRPSRPHCAHGRSAVCNRQRTRRRTMGAALRDPRADLSAAARQCVCRISRAGVLSRARACARLGGRSGSMAVVRGLRLRVGADP